MEALHPPLHPPVTEVEELRVCVLGKETDSGGGRGSRPLCNRSRGRAKSQADGLHRARREGLGAIYTQSGTESLGRGPENPSERGGEREEERRGREREGEREREGGRERA